ITDAGRAELRDWNHELVATAVPEHPRFKAGLSMLAVLPPEAAASALGSRIAQLERAVAATRAALEGSGDVPRLFLVETEYEPAVREAELAWVRGLLDELHRVRQKPDVARAQAPPQPVVGDAGAVVGHGEPRPVARPSLCPRRRARRRWPAARGRSASAAARPAPRPRVPLRRGRPAGPSAGGARRGSGGGPGPSGARRSGDAPTARRGGPAAGPRPAPRTGRTRPPPPAPAGP